MHNEGKSRFHPPSRSVCDGSEKDPIFAALELITRCNYRIQLTVSLPSHTAAVAPLVMNKKIKRFTYHLSRPKPSTKLKANHPFRRFPPGPQLIKCGYETERHHFFLNRSICIDTKRSRVSNQPNCGRIARSEINVFQEADLSF